MGAAVVELLAGEAAGCRSGYRAVGGDRNQLAAARHPLDEIVVTARTAEAAREPSASWRVAPEAARHDEPAEAVTAGQQEVAHRPILHVDGELTDRQDSVAHKASERHHRPAGCQDERLGATGIWRGQQELRVPLMRFEVADQARVGGCAVAPEAATGPRAPPTGKAATAWECAPRRGESWPAGWRAPSAKEEAATASEVWPSTPKAETALGLGPGAGDKAAGGVRHGIFRPYGGGEQQ